MSYVDNLAFIMPLAVKAAPCGIAYMPNKGWALYDLRSDVPDGTVADFICRERGALPISLNAAADEAFSALVRSYLTA